MIDLNQYEVWFVTGSQHLYGPETLEQVAQNLGGDYDGWGTSVVPGPAVSGIAGLWSKFFH